MMETVMTVACSTEHLMTSEFLLALCHVFPVNVLSTVSVCGFVCLVVCQHDYC